MIMQSSPLLRSMAASVDREREREADDGGVEREVVCRERASPVGERPEAEVRRREGSDEEARAGLRVEIAREHGRVTMADAIRHTGASRNTLKMHFRALLAAEMLVVRGRGRGAWYTLR